MWQKHLTWRHSSSSPLKGHSFSTRRAVSRWPADWVGVPGSWWPSPPAGTRAPNSWPRSGWWPPASSPVPPGWRLETTPPTRQSPENAALEGASCSHWPRWRTRGGGGLWGRENRCLSVGLSTRRKKERTPSDQVLLVLFSLLNSSHSCVGWIGEIVLGVKLSPVRNKTKRYIRARLTAHLEEIEWHFVEDEEETVPAATAPPRRLAARLHARLSQQVPRFTAYSSALSNLRRLLCRIIYDRFNGWG